MGVKARGLEHELTRPVLLRKGVEKEILIRHKKQKSRDASLAQTHQMGIIVVGRGKESHGRETNG